MSEVIFDCTQFISFELDDWGIDIRPLLADLEKNNNFKIKLDNKIEKRKLLHLEPFLYSKTIELFNQEFIGEFEEWLDPKKIPTRILNFGQSIQKIYENKNIKKMTVILVDYAYIDQKEDRIFIGNFDKSNIYEGLYHASCFGKSGNIIVIRLTK